MTTDIPKRLFVVFYSRVGRVGLSVTLIAVVSLTCFTYSTHAVNLVDLHCFQHFEMRFRILLHLHRASASYLE